MNDLFSLENDIVIVTGVSGQLGSEYASAILLHGASKVIGLDLRPSSKSEVTSSKKNENKFFLETDITDKTSLIDSCDNILLNYGVPTVLINNAGLDSNPDSSLEDAQRFENYPEDSWDKVIDVNLKGTFLCCQVLGPRWQIMERGSIINISSIYGIVSPDQSLYDYRRARGEDFYKPVAYSASKSGLINLTKYLSVYWAKENVRVNTLTIAGVLNNQDQDFLDVYNKEYQLEEWPIKTSTMVQSFFYQVNHQNI